MNIKKKLPQNISMAIATITSELTRVKETAVYKAATVDVKGNIETVVISLSIANRVLDMTLSPEAGMFYESELRALSNSVIAAFNEKMPINVDGVNTLVYPLWYGRHLVCSGKMMPWGYLNDIDKILPKPEAKTVVSVVELLKG